MSKAIVFLADGTEECEALITVDLLRRADIDVITASVMGKKEICSSHSVRIISDALAEDIDYSSADAIVLPGGIPGTYNLRDSAIVTEQVKNFYESGRIVAAICAAPSILAAMGLLDGKTATVNPGFESHCTTAALTYGKSAIAGNIVTGQAVGGAFEFALDIISLLVNKEAADALRKNICL